MQSRVPEVRGWLQGLQQGITRAMTEVDGQPFAADAWKKEPGEPLDADGVTMILEGGKVFERAGVGFSPVTGPKLPPSATQHRPELVGAAFEAIARALVLHSLN